MPRITFITSIGLIGVLWAGCAPKVLLEAPPEWPGQWSQRELYHTPNAYIYASSDAAAGYADRMTERVVKDLADMGEGTAHKGLIIVTDKGDPFPLEDVDDWFVRFQTTLGVDTGNPTSEEDEQRREWNEQEAMAEELGLSMAALFTFMPLPLSDTDLLEAMGFDRRAAESLAWAAVIPTRPALKAFARQLLDATLKQQDMPLAVRVMIAPMMPIVRSMMTDALVKGSQLILFGQQVAVQSNWSEQKKKELIEQYKERMDLTGKQIGVQVNEPAAKQDGRAPTPSTDESPGPDAPESSVEPETPPPHLR